MNQMKWDSNVKHFDWRLNPILRDFPEWSENNIFSKEESDFIIGHGISNDINFLNKGGLTVNYTKPIINTLKMTHFISKGELSIKNTLKHLNISGNNLHNAGNDAVLNYEIVKSIVRDYDLSLLLKEKVENYQQSETLQSSTR